MVNAARTQRNYDHLWGQVNHPTASFGKCVTFVSSGWTKHDLDVGFIQHRFEFLRVLRLSIDDQVTLADRKARFAIGKVSSNLQHPLPIWIGSASTNMNQTSLQLDHEQRVIGHQFGSTQHFRREEICRKQSFPVSC